MSEFSVEHLLATPSITVRDVRCAGTCANKSDEEYAEQTHVVFPYRGVYVRHLGADEAVAEAHQVLFFNATESYRTSHPVRGGDASLSMTFDAQLLHEIAPAALVRDESRSIFRQQRLRLEPRAQLRLASLRHRLRSGLGHLEAESIVVSTVQSALGARPLRTHGKPSARRRLMDRAKLLIASDCARRWTLAQIAAELACSPVYLTQTFAQIEGLPLYRYQLNLRLARALELLVQGDDLTSLGLDLGFSSHSHFSAAFRAAYGHSPSQFRRHARRA